MDIMTTDSVIFCTVDELVRMNEIEDHDGMPVLVAPISGDDIARYRDELKNNPF